MSYWIDRFQLRIVCRLMIFMSAAYLILAFVFGFIGLERLGKWFEGCATELLEAQIRMLNKIIERSLARKLALREHT